MFLIPAASETFPIESWNVVFLQIVAFYKLKRPTWIFFNIQFQNGQTSYKFVPREKEKQIFFSKRRSTRFNAVMICTNKTQIWTKSFEYW